MGRKPGPRPACFLQGQLDPQVATLVAVVHGHHGPGQLGLLRVVLGVVVAAISGEPFHAEQSIRSDLAGR